MDYKAEYEKLKGENAKIKRQLALIRQSADSKTYNLGDEFFTVIVKKLNEAVNADYTFVGELNGNSVKTLALHNRNKALANIVYRLQGTPCENVIGKKACLYKNNVSDLFPNDDLLKELGIKGYIGIPLFDSKKNASGILVSLFEEPILEPELVELVLLLFANKASAELEHKKIYARLQKLQQETKKNEEQYRLLIENQTDLIVKVDVQNRFTFVSPSYCKMFGKTEKELIGKTFVPLIHEDDQEHTLEEMKKLTSPPYTCYIEQRALTVNGWRWLAWTDTAILNAKGEIDSIIGAGRDITERKLIENRIIENEALLKRIQQIAKMGSFRHSFENNSSFWSENTAKIFGLGSRSITVNAEEIAQKMILKEDLQTFNDNLRGVINGNEDGHAYYRIRTPDGKIKHISSHAQLIKNSDGKPIELIGSVQDITELKNIEEELKLAKHRAEESDRLKSAFLANMSHEIRTPLNAILGFSNLIAKKRLHEDKVEGYANIIKSSSNQLVRIISDIIDISKIEAGELDLSFSAIDLHQFIDEKLEQLKLYLEEKGKTHLKIEHFIDASLTEISTDSDRFSQIILNLLTNAVKFTELGKISLFIKKADNKNIELTVSDTGVGIEKSNQEIIFQRFRQAKESDNFKGGTGLGLAITKALVEKMEGEISVESSPNKGSVFKVRLPLQPYSIEQNLIEEKSTYIDNKKMKTKILIAEDEEVNFLYINEVLADPGFETLHAWDGKQAVEMFEKEKPDLVIMDIKMPIMDGYEALRAIRLLDGSIPVIALTAHALSGDREKALEAGFDTYLSKPVSEESILDAVNQFVNK